jgi:hypothetical protein
MCVDDEGVDTAPSLQSTIVAENQDLAQDQNSLRGPFSGSAALFTFTACGRIKTLEACVSFQFRDVPCRNTNSQMSPRGELTIKSDPMD